MPVAVAKALRAAVVGTPRVHSEVRAILCCTLPRITRLQGKIFADNAGPSCRMFINQDPQHCGKVAVEMSVEEVPEIGTQTCRVAIGMVIDSGEFAFMVADSGNQ